MNYKLVIKTTIKSVISTMPVLKKWNNRRVFKMYCNYINSFSGDEKEFDTDIGKKQYIEALKRKKPDRFNEIVQKVRNYKPLINENYDFLDIIFCCAAYGFTPEEYDMYHLKYKKHADRINYMSDREVMAMVYLLNDASDIKIYNDKERTYKYFTKYYRRSAIGISNKADRLNFLSFIKTRSYVVKKSVNEAMGRGIELINVSDYRGKEDVLFNALLKQGKIILEDPIIQSSAMAQLNDSSVNTVRLISFNNNGEILIPFCFLKIGRKGSFVDNGGAGGILVGIDEKSGVTNTLGFDESCNTYKKHPDSKVDLLNFKLPEFNKAIKLCKTLASQTPTIRYIGWDLAHTDAGWVVVEGNGMSQLVGPQLVMQKGIKKDINTIIQKCGYKYQF